ncbi:Protein of unknown function [Gryllus bimaculatus]|nr:Protein of unknown function [Gryllus bimaculatus]
MRAGRSGATRSDARQRGGRPATNIDIPYSVRRGSA